MISKHAHLCIDVLSLSFSLIHQDFKFRRFTTALGLRQYIIKAARALSGVSASQVQYTWRRKQPIDLPLLHITSSHFRAGSSYGWLTGPTERAALHHHRSCALIADCATQERHTLSDHLVEYVGPQSVLHTQPAF